LARRRSGQRISAAAPPPEKPLWVWTNAKDRRTPSTSRARAGGIETAGDIEVLPHGTLLTDAHAQADAETLRTVLSRSPVVQALVPGDFPAGSFIPVVLPNHRALNGVAAVFGKRILGIPVAPEITSKLRLGGVTNVASHAVYVNEAATRPALMTFGHELVHGCVAMLHPYAPPLISPWPIARASSTALVFETATRVCVSWVRRRTASSLPSADLNSDQRSHPVRRASVPASSTQGSSPPSRLNGSMRRQYLSCRSSSRGSAARAGARSQSKPERARLHRLYNVPALAQRDDLAVRNNIPARWNGAAVRRPRGHGHETRGWFQRVFCSTHVDRVPRLRK
jgi:hypothetical protein